LAANPTDVRAVKKAQEALVADIQLALGNGADPAEVRARIELAKTKEQSVTDGANQAISHVLSYMKD
jgi:hypothetical protein